MYTLTNGKSTHTRYFAHSLTLQRIMVPRFWWGAQNFPVLLHQTRIKEQAHQFKAKKCMQKIIIRLTNLSDFSKSNWAEEARSVGSSSDWSSLGLDNSCVANNIHNNIAIWSSHILWGKNY